MEGKIIDLRSDTITLPTQEMREAMARAAVGDDVFREDPTVRRLEEVGAEIAGKEAALFVPSGTMGNQVALLTHTGRGDEVIVDSEAHIYYYEVGAPAVLASVILRPVQGLHGPGATAVLEAACRPADIHFPRTSLVCLENTHNRGGGTAMSPDEMKDLYQVAKSKGLSVHVDGARIFNAAVALGCTVKDLAANCDSIMFCLSKGLCAPAGSLLAGPVGYIERARKYRKMLGGGMRQGAGILAAAGLVALGLAGRLADDHANARRLAEGLAAIPGLKVNLEKVQSNIVVADISGTGLTSPDFSAALAERGVKVVTFGPTLVRFVTHREIGPEDVDAALEAVGRIGVRM